MPKRWLVLLGGLVFLLSAAAPRPVGAKATDEVALAIIVAKSSKLTNIALADLRNLFEGAQPEHEPSRLIPLNHLPKTADRVGFDRVVLQMSPEEVGRFWIARKIQGGANPPRSVSSLVTLRRVVQKLPGAIAYIRPALLSSEVRAIRVDGKLPEDAGYPLRYHP